MGEKVYFKFSVMDDTSIEKIIFHVTAVSGEINVLMNRDDKNSYPNSDTATRKGYSEIENLKYTAKKDGPLKGNYYMSVEAWSSAYYTVLVKVYRKD